jgi:flagellar biosynthesis protein FlhG
MADQANALRDLMERRMATPIEIQTPTAVRARTITITSGKGGVGKSNIALNLSIALAQRNASVCLLDANLGLGNIDLLCGLNGYWNLSHVVTGARRLDDIVLRGPGGVSVIPGASGLLEMADCPPPVQREILLQMEELERTHDFLIVDTGTGIHRSVRQFVHAADAVLLVTTPEPTSIADTYATIKALRAAAAPEFEILVNQAVSIGQARDIFARLQKTSRLFLHADVAFAGCVPRDECVIDAVLRRTPFLIGAPHAPASRAIQHLAHQIKNGAEAGIGPDTFFSRLWQRFASPTVQI